MSQNSIVTWLNFALQQMAAESYLHGVALTNEVELLKRLKLGSNNISTASPDDPSLPGKTRMTTVLADRFLATYDIIDHHANDASGFSATLMKDTTTGEYTLSFRSTEPRPALEGGDVERDGLFASGLTPAADGEISLDGFAFGQLIAMERYYLELTTSGKLPAGGTLNVTGFSLGGHLATIFTELHASQVASAYVFNASGRGRMEGFAGTDAMTLAAEAQQIDNMLLRFMTVLFNPQAGVTLASDEELQVFQAAREAHAANLSWNPFTSGSTENVYLDPRYRWAKLVTLTEFDTVGTAELEIRTGLSGIQVTEGAFAKITQIFGDAAFGDDTLVALSGLSAGPIQSVLIEGQPLLPGTIIPRLSDAGSSHSITLIVDSLAVQELIQIVDPAYRQAGAELLIRSASNTRAIDTVTQERAEGDSLEKTVDAFRKLFLGPTLPDPNPLNVDFAVGGFANFTFRNQMYAAMAEVRQAVQGWQDAGAMFTLVDLRDASLLPSNNSASLENVAQTETAQGLAYRYALKELNPFALFAMDDLVTDVLYESHNSTGQLDLFNPADGTGTLTAQYLTDRALFLGEKLALNQADLEKSTGTIHFKDFVLDGQEITATPSLRADRQFLFGSDDLDTLTGGSKADHLYGGGGSDLLEGRDGRDYLQGDAGIDRLDGGEEADTMAGGAGDDFYIVNNLGDEVIEGFNNGTDRVESSVSVTLGANVEHLTLTETKDLNGTGNDLNNDITGNDGINRLDGKGGTDHLIGGLGNDILLGGTGDNDLLEGGAGFDTYIYNAGDGADRIEDSDAKGMVLFNGQLLTGGIKKSGELTPLWTSADRRLEYRLQGTDLLVTEAGSHVTLTINENFQSGQMGITLIDEPDAPNYDNGRITKTIIAPDTLEPLDNDHNYIFTATPEWGSLIELVSGNDQIYSQRLSALIAGGYGHDRIYGGEGADQIFGGNYSSAYEELGVGDGDDVIEGRGGADEIEGDAGDDRIYGGEGNDQLFGDIGNFGSFNSPPSGDDFIDGGIGDDVLRGDYGADILIGGEGNDILAGDYTAHYRKNQPTDPGFVFDTTQAKDDFLDGGAGADQLHGDGGNDTLAGGAGSDLLYGDYGERVFRPLDGDLSEIAGNDVIDGGAGDDFIYGMAGDDILGGGDGVDSIYGDFDILEWPTAVAAGNDVIDAGAGNDQASGGGGDDSLFGGAGDDLLFGDADFHNPTATGDDVLDGGEGNDVLLGGLGSDGIEGGEGHDLLFGTSDFEWNAADQDALDGGAGDDWIFGEGGNDVMRGGEGTDLLFGDDVLTGSFVLGPIAFPVDGLLQGRSLLLSSAPGDDVLDGGAGNDYLAGGVGHDILSGGSGDDVLDGGAGDDLYEFNLGDGIDQVSDSGQGNDTILFGSGITPDSLTLTPDSGRILLKVGVGSDGVLLGGVGDVFGSQTIEQFQFDDGTTLTYAELIARGFDVPGTENDDVLFGTDLTNRLTGGVGNDTLFGGLSEDTYYFNAGDGTDVIHDSSTPNGRNTVVFGPGISASQLTLRIADDPGGSQSQVLVVQLGHAADAIQLGSLDRTHVFGPHAVDSFEFADGSRLSYEQLINRGFDIVGTSDSDSLVGTDTTDRIATGAGDDQVKSGAGDDLLDGGAGTDRLSGGVGNDTYVFGIGSGHDQIIEGQGTTDVVQLADGIAQIDVTVTRNGNDLVLSLAGGNDQLTIAHHFLLPMFQIEEIRFSDGSVLTSAFLSSPVIQGSQQSDVLGGTASDDVLFGLAGDDQLSGLAGDDRLDGGTGADQLSGGAGDDTYLVDDAGDVVTELVNEGRDTVLSTVSTQLSANVENLTLTGNATINGIGNELDNVLAGNLAANVLTGGVGNDTYVVGVGDTVVELEEEGTDTVEAGVSVTLGANVENLTLTGSASLIGNGNALDNALQADGSISILAGGDGNDTYLIGADGGDDILVETATGGTDTVIAAHDYRLPDNIENLTLLDPRVPDFATYNYQFGLLRKDPQVPYGETPVVGIGNALDNVLTGGQASNRLDGGLGADLMIGGAGHDVYVVDNVNDQVSELAGEGFDTIEASVSYVLSAEVERLRLIGEGAINGTGNALSNIIEGNAAFNVLDGGAGNDIINGGDGADTILFGVGAGKDVVGDTTLVGAVDTIQIASGLTSSDIEVWHRGEDLVLHIIGTSDELAMANFYGPVEWGSKQVGFADGTVWDPETLRALAVPRDATAVSDNIELTPEVDAIQFGRGVGTKFVRFDNNAGDIDIIQVASDVLPADVVLSRHYPEYEMIDLLVPGTGDKMTLALSTNYPTIGLEAIQAVVRFSDGTEWNLAWSPSNLDFSTGTILDDVVSGFPGQTLRGLAGDDMYIVDSASEVVVELPGEGIDTVQSTINYALPDNVENVSLADNFTNVGPYADNATGNELDNLIIGNTRDNILDGGAGNDVLVGGLFRQFEVGILETGNDILIGGEGDDMLMTDGGDFTFGVGSGVTGGPEINVSRQADDLFIGGTGNDTYLLHSQQQAVVELANEGIDTVKSTVTYTLGENLENLALGSPPARFDDEGNVLPSAPLDGIGNELDNLLIGSGDDNVLSGLAGRDTLWGGSDADPDSGSARSGNDTLLGGAGHDTYLFNLGDGIDTIQDVAAVGEGNRVQFGVGVARTDLTLMQDQAARTLTIQVGASGTDRLVLTNFDPTGANGSLVVETLAFADGSTASLAQLLGVGGPVATNGDDTFTTGSGNDVIDALGGNDTVDAGAGNDTLTGGSGNDTLTGGSGDDTYLFNAGDGTDTINDTSLPGEGNTVQFGQGIDPAGLNLDLGSLLIRVGTNGDALHLTTFDSSNALGPRTIENFRFADGTVLSYDQLVARGFDLTGTVGDDQITGTNVVDRISGLAGCDTIQAGAGNDLLNGGLGSDTYLFNLGDGIDTIQDVAAVGEGNRVQFGVGITQNNLTFTRDEAARTLTIQVGASGTDRLVLTSFDPTGANGSLVVETLAFADGSMVNLADLFINHAPTVTNPLADQTVPEDAPFSFVVPATTFADQDTDDVLTFSASLADGTALPGWLGFDASSAMFSGMPDDAQVGSLDLRVTATDRENLNVSDVFRLTVANVNEAPTVDIPLANQTAVEDTAFAFAVPESTFTDVDLGDVLTYSATLADGSPLPAWLNFNSTTQTFSGMPGAGDAGSLQIAMTATDNGNLSATDQFAFAISGPLPQTIIGTSGNDVLVGGRGDDTLTGLAGNDTLIGGLGHDLLDGGTGTDTMQGGAGNDTYVVDAGGDVVTELANEGTDTVQSALLTYTLGADIENLTLTGTGQSAGIGNALSNMLIGNSGANLLDGKGGADTMAGGAGDDLYMVDHPGDTVIERANEGALDSVTSSVSYALSENVENLVLTGTAAIAGTGNELDNVLTGNSAANVLAGLGGNDTYVIGTGDTVVEAANGGTDTVVSGITHTLATSVENLTLIGFSAVNGTGNALDNVLNGLLNLAGNTLTGEAGNDTYILGSGDQVVEAANGGIDTVQSGLTYTLGANVENLTLIGFSAVNGTGNSLNNTMTGNSANNTLSGANGNDTLRGGLGNDTVNGGSGNDTFLFGRGEGQDLIQDNSGTADRILYDAGINPLDLVISRQANDLRLTIHGTTDRVTIQNWYSVSTTAQIETIQAGNGQTMLSAQVDQLIQAMAGFTQQTGLTWDQAIDQRPQEVHAVLAASWH